MSSDRRDIQIMDASLCGLPLENADAQAVRAYYASLLALGVAYVQIPLGLLPLLGTTADPGRTVLDVPAGCVEVLPGFAAYLSAQPGMPGRTICECDMRSKPPPFADERCQTAGNELFFRDYTDLLELLAGDLDTAFCPRNAGELGTALAVEWLLAGGQRLTSGFMGVGGYAPLEEVLAALHVYRLLPEAVKLDRLRHVSEAYQQLTGQGIPAHKAVVGSALFDVESGVHVDGIAKNRQCYEPFAPEAVGAQRRIVIGKHSGKQALRVKLEELDIAGACDLVSLLELVREESMRIGGALDDSAFAVLVKQVKGGDAA